MVTVLNAGGTNRVRVSFKIIFIDVAFIFVQLLVRSWFAGKCGSLTAVAYALGLRSSRYQ